ncbi:hypothetical protein PAAG_12578 [Paracoccidioides lutzii Pb01]|uniref:Uncharacterized protein n=1 Tax=Paracoccidioides lutzii (strain ATCC MYA-826 / Pb01) TaxID=502779 RepID=A0A0A2V3Q0_PARBA|nr:hypothetical protein PAAG_12578 [Paracoccidioides lutzii Pb01]KGQ00765.1 hypothetical protein PAAG_12578 [Paracoccidioides lutzii Pb01]
METGGPFEMEVVGLMGYVKWRAKAAQTTTKTCDVGTKKANHKINKGYQGTSDEL